MKSKEEDELKISINTSDNRESITSGFLHIMKI
jgi:hypothetical protein